MIWTPNITNRPLYEECIEVLARFHGKDIQVETILKENPEDPLQHFILTYNEHRDKYYKAKVKKPASFNDLEGRIMQPGTSFGDYYFVANRNPIARGHILIMHKEELPMEESKVEEDLPIFSQIANETGLRILVNAPRAGASIAGWQHAHGYPFEVPLEFYLSFIKDHSMAFFPGRNCVYESEEAIRAADKVYELRSKNILVNQFVIRGYIGIVERQRCAEAEAHYGNSHPNTSLVIGVPNKQSFEALKTTSFDQDWDYFKKTIKAIFL